MATVSVKVPKEIEKELEEYMREEKVDRNVAVKKLFLERLEEWKEDYAVKMLSSGKVSFSKAADIAGTNVWDFARILEEKKVNWVSEKTVKKDLERM